MATIKEFFNQIKELARTEITPEETQEFIKLLATFRLAGESEKIEGFELLSEMKLLPLKFKLWLKYCLEQSKIFTSIKILE